MKQLKPGTYNSIANACIVAAVTSALLFERVGNLDWLAGSFGIVAGVTAAGLYFFNQWPSRQTHTEAKPTAQAVWGEELVPEQWFAKCEPPRKHRSELSFQHWYRTRVRKLPWNLRISSPFYGPLPSGQKFEFAHIVVEIINKLSREQTEQYDFVVASDGNLFIRPIGRAKAVSAIAPAEEESETVRDLLVRPN